MHSTEIAATVRRSATAPFHDSWKRKINQIVFTGTRSQHCARPHPLEDCLVLAAVWRLDGFLAETAPTLTSTSMTSDCPCLAG